MGPSDARLSAQAAFVARRLLAEELVRTKSPAEVRRVLGAALVFDRDRERSLDADVDKILRDNAQAIRGSGADYAEMFRKAKRMLAEKRKIPL